MKNIKKYAVILSLVFLLPLTSCAKGDEDKSEEIFAKYNEVLNFNCIAEITSNLGENILVYTVDFSYNREDSDKLTIVKPEEISDIGVSIEKSEGEFNVSFDDTSLEIIMPDIKGFTPVDVLSYLFEDVKTEYAETTGVFEEDGEEIWYLRFEGENEAGSFAKDLYFDEDFGLVRAEVFIEGEIILKIDIVEFIFI